MGEASKIPAQWDEIERLFADALELDGSARAAFLDALPDPAVRRELVSLLAHAHPDADATFIKSAVAAVADRWVAAVDAAPQVVMPGRRLGPYEITGIIGQGGMGAVYRARRADGQFDQDVAMKLVRTGFETDAALSRFRRERQILARLTHPAIARLLDGGTAVADTGAPLPYLVMEYVEGEPITTYCTRHALSLADTVALFRRVCDAVQYAHQQLIVHRDLKPSNILVTASGEPKLLDFGIARLLTDEAEAAAITSTGMQLLTPEYASPEQVTGTSITAASDIYALGVLLYELLTGAKAHQFTTLSPAEIARVVCDTEPTRPSLVVATPTTPARRRRQLVGDLDTIVMTALRKEPERRYRSVEALSEDLRRYLAGLPIAALPDSVGYRTAKFVRRNAWIVAASVALVASLVAGIVVSTYQARRAERRFEQVRQLAHALLFDVHDQIEQLPGSTAARQKIVETALEYLHTLERDATGDPALERDLAEGYLRIAEVQGNVLDSNLGMGDVAVESYRKARALYIRTAGTDASWYTAKIDMQLASLLAYRGDTKGALATYDQAHREIEPRALAADADADSVDLLARTYVGMAQMQVRMGLADDSLASAQRALEQTRRTVALNPGNKDRRAAAADAAARVGDALQRLGRPAEALPYMQETAALREADLADAPDNVTVLRAVMLAYSHLGDVLGSPTLVSLGDAPRAAEQYRKMTAIAERLVKADASDRRAEWDLANALLRLGGLLVTFDPEDGIRQLQRSAALLQALVDAEPGNSRFRTTQAVNAWMLGDALGVVGTPDQALREYDRAVQLADEALARDPADTSGLSPLMQSLAARALILAGRGQRERALRDASRQLDMRQARATLPNPPTAAAANLAEGYAVMGRVGRLLGMSPAGTAPCAWFAQSVDAYERAAAARPLDPAGIRSAAAARTDLASCPAR